MTDDTAPGPATTEQTAEPEVVDWGFGDEESPSPDDQKKDDAAPGEPKVEAKADEATGTVPEKYEFTFPEGVTIDPVSLEIVDPAFRSIGLTNAQAQALIPVYQKLQAHAQEVAKVAWEAQKKTWANQLAADKKIGGPRLAETKALAMKALVKNGDAELKELCENLGLLNNPAWMRAWRTVGAGMAEDTMRGGSSAGSEKLSEAERLANTYPKMAEALAGKK